MHTDFNILITGGAGFIGSHTVRRFVEKYPNYGIVNLDKLTYAGSVENLRDVAQKPNYTFVEGDICDRKLLAEIFKTHDIGGVINLAAESHVDRSIEGPMIFAQTNVMGTLALLETAREFWMLPHGNIDVTTQEHTGSRGSKNGVTDTCNDVTIPIHRFYQISTDEVYGALGATGKFAETSPYDPHSPYSASKAAADHFVRAYHDTYGLPTVISNCTNNYGPGQYPEKLIPLTVRNILNNKSLPVYGEGANIRDWVWVGDHVEAIDRIFHNGRAGETYMVGGGNEVRNIDLVRTLIRLTDNALGRQEGTSDRLIEFVADRAGHDFRYAADTSKIRAELGWKPAMDFETGLKSVINEAIRQ